MRRLDGWQPPEELAQALGRTGGRGCVVLDPRGSIVLLDEPAQAWLSHLLPERPDFDSLPGRPWREILSQAPLVNGLADLPNGGGGVMDVAVSDNARWRVRYEAFREGHTLLHVEPLPEGATLTPHPGDAEAEPSTSAAFSGALADPRHLETFLHEYPLGALAFFDARGRYVAAGGRAFEALGRSPEELVGRTLVEVWPPETARMLAPLYEAALDGVSQTATLTLEGRTHVCWISPVEDTADGGRRGLFFTCDLTETSTARRRYERVFQACPMPAMVHAGDGRVLAVNDAWCRGSGHGRRVLTSVRAWAEVAAPESGELRDEVVRACRPGGVAPGRAVPVRTADGRTLRWEMVSAPLPEEPGGGQVYVTMARDVTERQAQHSRLERRNRELRVITAASRSLFRSDSEEDLLERVSEILVGIAGYHEGGVWLLDEEGALGPPETHLHYEPRPGSGPGLETRAHAVHRALEAQLPWITELDEGQPGTVLAAYPLGADGQVPGVLLAAGPRTFHDDPDERHLLTELATDLAHGILTRRTEAQGSRLARRLKRTERLEALGQLTSGVAHDFNNTLAIILGQTEILQATPELSEEVREDLEQIRRAALKSAQITGQLLSFSREDGSPDQVVDLQDAIASCHSLLVFLVGEKHPLHLTTAVGGPIHVDIQGSQLEQIVINLVVNARDASPGGGPIELSAGRTRLGPEEAARLGLGEGPWARFSVRDEGVGMDRDTAERIFDPFFTTKERGTGLGLATVRDIVRARRGAVGIDTAPGEGTTFTVYLPLSSETPASAPPASGAAAAPATAPMRDAEPARRPTAVAPGPASSPAEAAPTGTDPGRRTILLVEDDPVVQDVFSQILRFAGHEVRAVESGEAALSAWEAMPEGFSMVITDVVLPDTTGTVLAARIRESRPGVPVAFTSGYAMDDLRTRHGFDEPRLFLKKPFTSRDILELVERALGEESAPGGS
jgi:PAS domain S-box-containing protein